MRGGRVSCKLLALTHGPWIPGIARMKATKKVSLRGHRLWRPVMATYENAKGGSLMGAHLLRILTCPGMTGELLAVGSGLLFIATKEPAAGYSAAACL